MISRHCHRRLAARDERDKKRTAAPLVVPEGAVLINTSGMTPDQSSSQILSEIKKMQSRLGERRP